MLHLYLVRHAETDWNSQHRYQGFSDLPLNARGLEQARQLAGRFQAEKTDLVFSSDLQRAMQTAQILIGGRQIPLLPDPRLREINFGMLEGHTFDEAMQRWPEMITKWVDDNNQAPEGGERFDDFTLRVTRFYSELKQNCAEKTVLIVAHGGPLREIIRSVLEMSGSPAGLSAKLWIKLDHCSLTEFMIDTENIIINRVNDAGYSIYT